MRRKHLSSTCCDSSQAPWGICMWFPWRQLHGNKLSGLWWCSTVSAFMKMESNYNTPACTHLSQNQMGLSTPHAAEVLSQGTDDETGNGFNCYRRRSEARLSSYASEAH